MLLNLRTIPRVFIKAEFCAQQCTLFHYQATFAAAAAAVADGLAGTLLAGGAEPGAVAFLFRQREAPAVGEPYSSGFPGEIDTGAVSHAALQAFAGHPVLFAVLNKQGTGFDKAEGGVVFHTVLAQAQHPFKPAGAAAVVIFPTANHPFNLAVCQILTNAHRPDKRRAHNALVPEWQLKQQWNAFIRPALVLAGDIKEYILPAGPPVLGQAGEYPLRPLGEQKSRYPAAGE